jgi:ribosomal protein S18 acetylase RimI-like enzyme
MTGVRALERCDRRDAARLLTAAFIDEPLWRFVGPSWSMHRRLMLNVLHHAELAKARRWGGPSFAAEHGGSLAGVAVVFDAGRWPPPQPWSTLRDVPSLLLAGPLAALRAGQIDWVVDRLRPPDPHVYLYLLGVAPGAQRRGVGTRLVDAVIEHATQRGLPVHLETMSPRNPPFYERHGFVVERECELPGGMRAWLMRRSPG